MITQLILPRKTIESIARATGVEAAIPQLARWIMDLSVVTSHLGTAPKVFHTTRLGTRKARRGTRQRSIAHGSSAAGEGRSNWNGSDVVCDDRGRAAGEGVDWMVECIRSKLEGIGLIEGTCE